MAIFITWIALSFLAGAIANNRGDRRPGFSFTAVASSTGVKCGRFVALAQNGGTRKRRFAAFCDRLDEPWR